MAVVFLPKGSIMRWVDTTSPSVHNSISEHNRAPLAIDVERIEKTHRMANGLMRKYVIADKRTFSTSWEGLPHAATRTVDGKWGGREIEAFYNAQAGPFNLEIVDGDATVHVYSVMFTEFSKTITRRGSYDFWNISITMEEC